MGLISEVKCSRCDRRYSGMRSRCPYCGARRTGRGKHADVTDNSFGKLLVGILILIILIAAVLVLIISGTDTMPEDKDTDDGVDIIPSGYDPEAGSANAGMSTVPGVNVPTLPTDPSPEPTSVPVESIAIMYLGEVKEDITMNVGDSLGMEYDLDPSDTTDKVKWSTSDTKVFTISQSGELKAVGSGTATLTLAVGALTVECLIRVN